MRALCLLPFRKCSAMNKKTVFILTAVAAGFLLRVGGIGYGLPELSHPDEARVVLDTLSMAHRMSLIPERPDYALLYRYLLLGLFGAYFLVGKIAGLFSSPYDFAFAFMTNHSGIYLLSRMVSVIFGTAIGLAAYWLAKRVFKKGPVGVCALVFCLFEFQLLQHSQWALYAVVFSFFTLPAFYGMFRLCGGGSLKDFILAGGAVGLAISVQNQGIYLLPGLAIAAFYGLRNAHDKPGLGDCLKRICLMALALILVSLAGNFYWFFIFDKSLAKTLELMGVTQVGFSSIAPYRYNIASMLWWFMGELIRQDGLLGIAMIGGIAYSAWRRTPQDLIFLSFLFIYLWSVSSWGFRLLHDLLSLLPISCIFAARFLTEAGERSFRRPAFYVLVSCLIVSPLALDAYKADLKKSRPDTRQLAARWIEENIPAGSMIAVDWQVFSVPLKSAIPFLFRNPIAQKYYERMMPEELKQRYGKYLEGQKSYRLFEVMYATDEPLWPKDMPASAFEKAQKSHVFRDLYSRFNFRSIPDIREAQADYIVITSYAWGFFLLDGDPHKEGLFNAFIKDNPKAYYRHTDRYIEDNRHGPVFFLARQAREFYEPLLYNRAEGIRLLKEFAPTDNLGPRIKIFELDHER